MLNGKQISLFDRNEDISSLSEIPDDVIFYVPKIIGELGLALDKGLNKTEIKSTFQKFNTKKIDIALGLLEELGYIQEIATDNRTERRYSITISGVKKLQEMYADQ
ncbi:MAG TPA: hypothetical protein GX394_08290 [Clostridiales bacterium]|jgi:hypothetical protein|nr:hypothetical protein [Clostridiales bacterium]